MTGILKKIMPLSHSKSCKESVDFDADISIALEYTGIPVSYCTIPMVVPVNVNQIPTANVAISPTLLNDLVLPVIEPVARTKFRDNTHVIKTQLMIPSELNSKDVNVSHHDPHELQGFEGKWEGEIESSDTLGFSDSQDHSHELSESSNMLESPFDCQEIEEFENCARRFNGNDSGLHAPVFSNEIWCEEEESSDGEALECNRRRKKPAVTFCDPDTAETVGSEDIEDDNEGFVFKRRVAEKPAKRGVCYHCHRGNRFTEKEVCIVCNAKYCKHCIRKVMGTMTEGRKCIDCIGYAVNHSKYHILGKYSRVLKSLLSDSEVEEIMKAEKTCRANQLPPNHIIVNGSPLSMKELLTLRVCSNPPRNLKKGRYWYDKVSGFWGKEGQRPCQIITPQLNIKSKIRRDASNGDTNIEINEREITQAEKWILKLAGIPCDGNPHFWVDPDGTCQEEGMQREGKIWRRKRTRFLCSILLMPTPKSPNPRGKFNRSTGGAHEGDLDQKALYKVLLVGNDRSGTSTVYKQARFLFGTPFSKEEREDMKAMIQRNLYGYLFRLLEGCEQFEEESLEEKKLQFYSKPGPSVITSSEILEHNEYTIGPNLKAYSDWLINIMVSGNLDKVFPDATQGYGPYVEELWKDAAIQATYNRKDELHLPKVASYFLDKSIEVANADYVPSDTDILYAEGFTCNGLVSMEFSLPQASHDYKEPTEPPHCPAKYQLIRMHSTNLGENCKWLEMFEGTRIVLFCVSLTEYDEYEVNSNEVLTNKMMESKKFFESIVTRSTLKDATFLLLLNKFDLLEDKIEKVPLSRCEWFQDFNPVISHNQTTTNMAPLAQRAFHYIAVKFKRLYKSLTGRKLYVCPVTALESDFVDSALRYAGEIVEWEEDKASLSLNEYSCESTEIEQSSCSQSQY